VTGAGTGRRLGGVAAIAAVALSAAAWAGAPADPGTARRPDPVRIQVPPGWRSLPAIARAATGDGADAPVAEAWGDPARGCFGLVDRTTATAPEIEPAAVERWIREALAGAHIAVSRSELETADHRLASRFELSRDALRGRARTVIAPARGDTVRAVLATCVWTQREPAVCRARCDSFLDSLEVRR
jgi:hypothetical protein